MRFKIPEGQTPAQHIVNLGLDGIVKAAKEQGYANPESVADRIFSAQREIRNNELDDLIGEQRKVGETALLVLSSGLVVKKDELTRS